MCNFFFPIWKIGPSRRLLGVTVGLTFALPMPMTLSFHAFLPSQVEAKEKTFHTSFCGGKRISFTLTLVLTISIGLSYRQFLRSEIRSDYTRLSRRKVLSTVGTFQCLATSNNSCTGLATFGVRSGYKKEANQGVPRQLPSIDISYYLSIASNATYSFGVDVTRPNRNPIQSKKNYIFLFHSFGAYSHMREYNLSFSVFVLNWKGICCPLRKRGFLRSRCVLISVVSFYAA